MTPVLSFEEMRLVLELYSAILVFLIPFAPKKPRFLPRVLIFFSAATAFTLLYFPVFQSKTSPRYYLLTGFWYVAIFFSVIFFARFCFKINWCNAIFISIASFCTQNIVYVILHEWIARLLFPALREHVFLYVLAAIFCCAIVYTIIYYTFARQLARCNGVLFDDTLSNLMLYTLMFFLIIVTFFFFQRHFNEATGAYDRSTWLPEFISCIFLLVVQYSLFYSRNLYMENAKLEQYLNNSQKYYDMSKEQIEIINRKCHDLKHTLKVIATLSEEERQSYIKEAQRDIMFYQQLVHSDNEVINTILAEKGLFCAEKDITLSCSVDSMDLSFIKATDLYAILGNALDNAIEYVEKLPSSTPRVITFRVTTVQQFLSIQVNNPYHGPVLPENKLPSSTKLDFYNHGYGLKSIRYLARQYGGWLEISTQDAMFTLQILLPIHKPASG